MHCSSVDQQESLISATALCPGAEGQRRGTDVLPRVGMCMIHLGTRFPQGWRSWCTPTTQLPRTISREVTLPSFNNHPVTSRVSAFPFSSLSETHTQALHPHGSWTGIQMQASASLPSVREKQMYSNTLLSLPHCSSGESHQMHSKLLCATYAFPKGCLYSLQRQLFTA